ncbi:uncharacterized protein SAMN04488698_11828 [Candidatus Frackibacter sp. WG12]|uniref:ATP-dependent sacrificial sulfur transferase LarE n=1 Tax=unclassified Candidatus Frackibacter TaxID=2648818 RepID=UPI000890AA91|nr:MULTISPECIES: ATP-dependent sacrificial sulfur transferase LarE [unclassified Candidatus Frackibacter]SDC47174.1 uncharacterized protein SAMN04515661_11122 [Candidatus Frackibacter sp. WG11]SEM81463.1 uncharacterized protein SAMN04488698_11828 [Candidatus Frackibacter sp. WG12]
MSELSKTVKEKYNELQDYLANLDSLVIGFSGGVDSTFLLKVAYDVLGDKVLAVTSSAETYPAEQLEEAKELAKEIGAQHLVTYTEELDNEDFVKNPPRRCYYCKFELFKSLKEVAEEKGYANVADGANYDDISDYRPGADAAKELGVLSPLKETGFTKDDIREVSKELGLPTWNKAAFACLSSRFPYGDEITADKLEMVDQAEAYLRQYSWQQLRVRHHDENTARIEILSEDFEQLLNLREDIVNKFKEIGYTYITMDLEGYRTGSMNEVLNEEDKK